MNYFSLYFVFLHIKKKHYLFIKYLVIVSKNLVYLKKLKIEFFNPTTSKKKILTSCFLLHIRFENTSLPAKSIKKIIVVI